MSVSAQSATVSRFAEDVRAALTGVPRKLPPEYLYDELGTALFEAITYLPEYGLTRAEERILISRGAELARLLGDICTIVELGSGTGRKTRHILSALGNARTLSYFPIDVSQTALRRCEVELGDVAAVRPVEARYLEGLGRMLDLRPPGQNVIVLFLGSSIGNFDRKDCARFLSEIRSCLRPGDALLVGADLVKPAGQLLTAYDDPIGLTSAFNLNVLARINRELGANFDLRSFVHMARYDARHKRVEMHLRSRARQRIEIPGAGFGLTIEKNETIWTESSYKFDLPALRALARSAGFKPEADWKDAEWPFVLALWRVAR
jgi:dimethylhistidine N-methyltransferase